MKRIKTALVLVLALVGLSNVTLMGCTPDDYESIFADQEHTIITITNAACIAYKPRSGLSAMIQESNAASFGRLPSLWHLGELEGSGITEPPAAGLHVWTGDITEDDAGNRVFTGVWRVATQAESDDLLVGVDPF